MKFRFNIISAALLLLAGGMSFTSCSSEGDDFDYNKSGLFVSGTENNPVVKFVVEDTPASYAVTVQSTKKVESDVTLTLAIDPSKVDEYNAEHTTNYFSIPEGAVELEQTQVTISKDAAISAPALVKVVSTEDFVDGRTYLIPVTVKSVSGTNEPLIETSKTIFLRVSRVLNFFSIQANSSASSNFIFDKAIPLTTLTYEVKIYPQGLNRTNYPQRFMALEEENEKKSLLLRFNEANSDNKLQVILADNKFISKTEFENGHWYLLSFVYDGSTVSLYVNGVLDTSIGAKIDKINFKRYEMGMSWGGYTTSQFFAHRFCEIRIWDRALSASEIAGGICGVDPQSDGLKAYWKFNEGSGHIFKDATGNGFDMDWSKTSRDVNESGNMTPTPNAANAINWVKDDINKCAQ
ncbi:DUF1735 and LamG domain-containing protein [Prevotella sp. KH2C16]|uniref:DUF1735 and LamG domain-containing protein n=1 Tax=Prevotella sp. KH2C16 TaxID=1855325 RepID=UPI0008EA3051|nr:DUF1735 and LamG domain-containing protein [Prevotella sp. KH2C16]SFG03354.1 Concanavalin A-like lectin/glucanases superfamily protein [Prevotella sp. KH2C16]